VGHGKHESCEASPKKRHTSGRGLSRFSRRLCENGTVPFTRSQQENKKCIVEKDPSAVIVRAE